MLELRIHISGGPKQTDLFVGNKIVQHVQKVIVSQDEIRVFFPPPNLEYDDELRQEIEDSIDMVKCIPGVVIGHIFGDHRCFGDIDLG